MAQNINQITAPRVDFLDQNGKITREWYMFLYNLYAITGAGSGITPISNGGTGLGTLPTNGQLLIGNQGAYSLNTLGAGTGISVTNGPGTIVLANTGVLSFSGGTTGLTPVAAAVGAVVLGGKLVIANGGTNSTATPTAGAVAYGTGTAYAFTAAGTTNQALLSAGAGTPTWNTLTSGSSILYGNGSGLFSNVTIGSGVSFVGGTLSATGTGGTVTSVTGTSPVVSSGGATPAISLAAAYGDTLNPYAAKTANYVLAGPTTGAAAVPAFRALVSGDIPSLSYVSSVSGTAPVVSSGGLTPAISMAAANTSTNGYLTSTDWNTFNNKQPAGTYVTSVAVASSNGFAGTSSGGATPTLTLTTSISGVLYGNGTAIAAATISAPLSYSAGTLSITQAGTASNGYLSSTDWNTFNNKGSGTVTSVTGTAPVVSSGGTTPAISMAAANTTTNGYLTSTDWNTFNNKGSGTVTSVAALTLGTTGTDLSSTVANGTTTPVITLNVPTASATNRGALSAADWTTFNSKGSGSVTSVSVVSANGFAGTVATATTTPAITLTTTITGLLKGNGTAISAATANTDYMGVAAPVTKTADFTVSNGDIWYINNKSGSTCTVTLPAASSWTGRSLTFKNMQAQSLVSASSNVVPIDSTTAGTAILLNVVGNWATMVSDGTNWVIMQAASNNNLLLE